MLLVELIITLIACRASEVVVTGSDHGRSQSYRRIENRYFVSILNVFSLKQDREKEN